MHIGAPDTPLVKVGDTVQVGQKIAEGGYMSSPIYASVSGTVKKIDSKVFKKLVYGFIGVNGIYMITKCIL